MPVEEKFTDHQAFLETFKAREERRPDQVRMGIKRGVTAGVPLLLKVVPVGATGVLKYSAHVEFSGHDQVALVFDAPYAAFVEVGTRPHWMPIAPLLQWVEVKLGVTDEREAYGIAKAIQAKIAREGTKPTWFMKRLLPRLAELVKAEVKKSMDEDDGR